MEGGGGRGARRVTARGALAVVALAVSVGCTVRVPASHPADPLGWPAHALHGAGWWLEDSEVAVAAELGALIGAVGWWIEVPALLVEGLLTLSPEGLGDGGRRWVDGAGKTVTAAINLPFALLMGPRLDLGADADAVNAVLVELERREEAWRVTRGSSVVGGDGGAAADDGPGSHDGTGVAHEPADPGLLGPGRRLLPRGTRVRASGRNLVWTIPGRGELLQRGEVNVPWWIASALGSAGSGFVAQERSWGFVVPSRAEWEARSLTQRAVTIVHEAWHQRVQIEGLMWGWSLVYWPGYFAVFPFTGWDGHWAETGSWGAARVERTLFKTS